LTKLLLSAPFDVNRVYQVLTWVVQDAATPTRKLIWHFDYGTSGAAENRLLDIYYPSACSDYNTSTYAVTLRTTAAAGVHRRRTH
jgi:hypothetical protein